MNKADLEAILEEKRVSKMLYSFGVLKTTGECMCAIKDGEFWKVVYVERDQPVDVAKGLTEEEAYDYIYNDFKKLYGWQ